MIKIVIKKQALNQMGELATGGVLDMREVESINDREVAIKLGEDICAELCTRACLNLTTFEQELNILLGI